MTVRKDDDNIYHTGLVTVFASKFKVLDDTDPTKVAQFNLTAVTTGTVSDIAIPSGDDTVVFLTASQTLTNKTLTAPTINAATLTGAISGGTVAPTALTVPASTSLTTPSLVTPAITSGGTLSGSLTGGTLAPTTLTVPAGTALATPALTAPTVATSLLITSTTGALGIPVMTEAQRDALTPAAGWLVYNSTTNKLNVRVAAAWEVIVSA